VAVVGLFAASNLGHPLLTVEKKVTNDFYAVERGNRHHHHWLKHVGQEHVSAYHRHQPRARICRRASQRQPLANHLFRLFTCIRVSDSVTEGYSYFYAECAACALCSTPLEEPDALPLFFLIDEIFKGTNNRERLIGSRSYVHAVVGKNCVGAISTHDLEAGHAGRALSRTSLQLSFREEVVNEKWP